jgi:transposase-like protein
MSISAEDRLEHHVGRVTDPDPEVPERAKRRSYTARYKLEILDEYVTLERDGKGALLRREGLYSSLLSEWRKQRDKGALDALAAKPGRQPLDPVERENVRLRQRVGRLEDELGTARRVIEGGCLMVCVRGLGHDLIGVHTDGNRY